MKINSWEIEKIHAQSVLEDMEKAEIDISKPLAVEDQDSVRKILFENARNRTELIRKFEED